MALLPCVCVWPVLRIPSKPTPGHQMDLIRKLRAGSPAPFGHRHGWSFSLWQILDMSSPWLRLFLQPALGHLPLLSNLFDSLRQFSRAAAANPESVHDMLMLLRDG